MKFNDILEKEIIENNELLQNDIFTKGFSFEGKKFPYSIEPLVITRLENDYFLKSTESLSECLEVVLDAYSKDSYIRDFFGYYDKYKDLIDITQKGRNVVISRFDVAWHGGENYKIFECNTCCPGGVSILGSIKEDYVKLPVIKKLLKNKKHVPFVCDSTENFIKTLLQQYKVSCEYKPEVMGIAFANYKGLYTYELNELVERVKDMGFNAVSCDLEELEFINGKGLYYKDIEINIVYNKIDQLMLTKQLMQPIIKAINAGTVISANPFAAMYITESKLVLALLQDKIFQDKYLNSEQIRYIKKHIPWTKKLKDQEVLYKEKQINLISYIKVNKNDFVIKIDNETRGSNVFIGEDSEIDIWIKLIDKNKDKNWIVQEYCDIPRVSIPKIVGDKVYFEDKHFGIDFFMYNGKFAGVVSRISDSKIINVGSGGCEQPVLLVEECFDE